MKNQLITLAVGRPTSDGFGRHSKPKLVGFGVVLVLALILVPIQTSLAQGTLSININAINSYDLQMPPTMVISTATAGQDPDPVTATSTWAFTSNGNTERSMVASLDTQPPAGLSISVDFGTPTDSQANGAGASVGSASIGTFDSSDYEDVTLWSGARRARASGNVSWTATATNDVSEDDDYSGFLTVTFE